MVADTMGMFRQASERVDIILDPAIRNFVMFPILLVILMKSFLISNIMRIMKKPSVEKDQKKLDFNNRLTRSKRTRANANFLSTKSFNRRSKWLRTVALKEQKAAEKEEKSTEQSMEDMQNVLGQMQGGSIGNFASMGLMMWANSFFSGFVLLRLPFEVQDCYRGLVQRGIVLKNLDCSYVSSLAWYFSTSFGLRGLTSLLQQGTGFDEMKMMANPMGGMQQSMQPSVGAYDPNPQLKAERNGLSITNHEFHLDHIETLLLEKWDA